MRFCLFLSLSLFSFCLFAQSSGNKKAQTFFEKANPLIQKQDYTSAEQALKSAVEADPLFQNAYVMLAGLYKIQKKYPDARTAYEKAILINKTFAPEVMYGLAETEFATQDYLKAKQHFSEFLMLDSSSDRGRREIGRAHV